MALCLPGVTESDVRETDGGPGEDGGETGERVEPVQCGACGIWTPGYDVAEKTKN